MKTGTDRVVLVRYRARDGEERAASGFLLAGDRVLTADHVAVGGGHEVEALGRLVPVRRVVRSGSPEVDLAVLLLATPVTRVEPLPLGRVDTSGVAWVADCAAVGFPQWRRNGPEIRSAQVRGRVPTAEGLVAHGDGLGPGTLTLVGDRDPAPPIPQGDLDGGPRPSPWSGMSGAAVLAGVAAGRPVLLGVVSAHNAAAGGRSLTFTPVSAVELLAAGARAAMLAALGAPEGLAYQRLPDGPDDDAGRVGSPLAELDPVKDLHVHACVVGRAAVDGPAPLPAYLHRPHDTELRRRVRAAVCGPPDLIVLVAGSMTGKTRAAYEALRAEVPAGWRVYAPGDPRTLCADEAAGRIGPRTVIWLDHAGWFFTTNGSPEAVAALERLLRTTGGPLFVVVSMWDQHWELLAGGEQQLFSRSSGLLLRYGHLRVAENFDAVSAEQWEPALRHGTALREAVAAKGRGGEIAQYLGGAFRLLDRYRGARPEARRVIDAALDFAVVDTLFVTRAMLAELASPGDGARPDPGIADLLTELASASPVPLLLPVPGDDDTFLLADYLGQHATDLRPGPLRPEVWAVIDRHVKGTDRWPAALAAYIRGHTRVAAILWSDYGRITLNAYAEEKITAAYGDRPLPYRRPPWRPARLEPIPVLTLLMSLTVPVWTRFSTIPAMLGFVALLSLMLLADHAVALRPSYQATLGRQPDAAAECARRAELAGRWGRALRWTRRELRMREAPLRRFMEPGDEDNPYLRRFFEGAHRARCDLARRLEAVGAIDEAAAVFPPEAAQGLRIPTTGNLPVRSAWTLQSPPLVLLRAGRPGDAARWMRSVVDAGDRSWDRGNLGELLLEDGRIDEALDCLRETDHPAGVVQPETMDLLIDHGRVREAADLLLRALESGCERRAGILTMVTRVADALEEAALHDDLITLLRAAADGPLTVPYRPRPERLPLLRLGLLWASRGQEGEAVALHRHRMWAAARALNSGDSRYEHADPDEVMRAESFAFGLLLARLGRREEAADLPDLTVTDLLTLSLFADPDAVPVADILALPWPDAVRLLEAAGRSEDAVTLLQSLLRSPGGPGGRKDRHVWYLKGVLARAGRLEECYRAEYYGVEPDGRPSEPWHWRCREPYLFTGAPLPPPGEVRYRSWEFPWS
ncbi:hypothetical protein AB0K09_16665 [Streptomyces sp. NPDC049577]|uniref:hypothetical protein n=1 Tax=Streptomyces sp. NPDC049577 TaxID=3155153 RepID=UPI003440E707